VRQRSLAVRSRHVTRSSADAPAAAAAAAAALPPALAGCPCTAAPAISTTGRLTPRERDEARGGIIITPVPLRAPRAGRRHSFTLHFFELLFLFIYLYKILEKTQVSKLF